MQLQLLQLMLITVGMVKVVGSPAAPVFGIVWLKTRVELIPRWRGAVEEVARTNDLAEKFIPPRERGVRSDEKQEPAEASRPEAVDEGQAGKYEMYFRLFVKFGITPDAYRYTCIVNLLARSGCLDEAETVLQTMPFKIDVTGWRSLLSACKSYGDRRGESDGLIKL